MTRFKIIVAVLFILTLAFFFHSFSSLKEDRDRLSANQTALFKQIEFYKLDSTKNVASVHQLRLTAEELRESNLSLTKDIDDLNIKLKRVNSASSVSTKTVYNIETVLKDSIRFIDSVIVHSKCLSYETPYLTIDGCIENDSTFKGIIESRDSLVRVEHRVPRKFLGIKFGTKFVKEEFLSKNPHTTITHVESIVVIDNKKKNR